MPATLTTQLVKVRSQFVEEVLFYLREVQRRLGELPAFIPAIFNSMKSGSG